jgi:predicted RNase H-like HicB family nuclease
MNYPIWIHKDPKSLYGVTVPDLPGCFSLGSTFDEAVSMAREAIELHLEGMIEDGEAIPEASEIEELWRDKQFAGGAWASVTIDPSKLPLKAERVNITMPKRILEAVDRFAAEHDETRSGLLLKAITQHMAASKEPRQRRQTAKR